MPANNMLTVKQAAAEKVYGSISTIKRRINDGTLPAYRYADGRYLYLKREDLDALFKREPVTEQALMEAIAKEIVAKAPGLTDEHKRELAALLQG